MLQATTEPTVFRRDQPAAPVGGNRPGVFRWPGTQWLNPVQFSATTLRDMAVAVPALEGVVRTMGKLQPDDYLEFMLGWYATGLESFGDRWQYLDLLTVLRAAAAVLQPRSFLEIGVRRGRSMAVVADAAPHCDLLGFDLWVQDYAGMPNPGAEFVCSEIGSLGHRGRIQLVGGDSHQTVPAFLRQNPAALFDLVNVDGDHSEEGARRDLETVLPRLALGGVIVMDDIVHPQHRYLESVWDDLVSGNPHFSSCKYTDLGYGVAFAVRKESP